MEFVIEAVRPGGAPLRLIYDNTTSELLFADSRLPATRVEPRAYPPAAAIGPEAPGRKEGVTTLKISLGLSCNYACTYCSQRFVPHAAEAGVRDVEPFLAKLPSWFDTAGPEGGGKGIEVEFWGGEPFVYWKALRPLAEGLRAMMPGAVFLVITNGSLLTLEINEWLDRMGFNVGLSHDGPGQATRGPDPLDDPEKAEAIRDLYRRLRPQGRMSFNAMIHRGNQSRAAVQAWFQARFGADVPIGEGGFIDAYDAGGATLSLRPSEHHAFRRQAFTELREGGASNFLTARQRITDFENSVKRARPAAALGQKCGMDRPDNIAVTLRGDVVTCQNVSPISRAPNGKKHKIGSIDALADVKLDTARHWSTRKDCAACPMLQLCKGSCMFLEGKLWDVSCENAFSDAVPFFAAAVEHMTGAIPVRIEGARPDREWIWGQEQ